MRSCAASKATRASAGATRVQWPGFATSAARFRRLENPGVRSTRRGSLCRWPTRDQIHRSLAAQSVTGSRYEVWHMHWNFALFLFPECKTRCSPDGDGI